MRKGANEISPAKRKENQRMVAWMLGEEHFSRESKLGIRSLSQHMAVVMSKV